MFESEPAYARRLFSMKMAFLIHGIVLEVRKHDVCFLGLGGIIVDGKVLCASW